MPSITTWNRLEPRSRAPSLSLAAPVRDPLWMLARQVQFGEFQGADSGSPAFAQIAFASSLLTGWRVEGDIDSRALPPSIPLESLMLRESVTPDLTLRAELGQFFEGLVADALATNAPRRDTVLAALKRGYPIPSIAGVAVDPPLLTLPSALRSKLDQRSVGAATAAFAQEGIPLSARASITVLAAGSSWRLEDPTYERCYLIKAPAVGGSEDGLAVHLETLSELGDDRDALRFLEVCAGRSIDGIPILCAALADAPILAATTAGDEATLIREAGRRLGDYVRELYGDLGDTDAVSWKPERLEYRMEMIAPAPEPGGKTVILTAAPGRDGTLDWDAFDLRPAQDNGAGSIHSTKFSVIPGHVHFSGMPNARFWDFEDGRTAFGEIQPDKRDLAKLVMMDFMLVHGNDWFVIPLELEVGALCRIDTLIVRDVFGIDTLVERADAASPGATAAAERWTLFSTSVSGQAGEIADFLFIPPTAAATAQIGPTVEEVVFLRDEMANLAWGVERMTENGIGEPWPGYERSLIRKATPSAGSAPAQPAPGTPPLRYVLQTTVPEHWIPFIPVTVDPLTGKVALERSLLPRANAEPPENIQPLGRILRPSSLEQGVYRLFEEEVPREGARVSRAVFRSRWTDGSTHLWIARRKAIGAGEGASGLEFDVAVPTGSPSMGR